MRERKELLDKADWILKKDEDNGSFSPVEFSEVARWRLSFEVGIDIRDQLFQLRRLLDLIRREGGFK